MPSWWPSSLLPWASFGAGAGAGFVFLKAMLEFFAGRMDKSRDSIDAATSRLIEGLERRLDEEIKNRHQIERELREELKQIRFELADCKRLHAESEAERLRLAALIQGRGDARQTAALIVAAEKREARR